jgi:hypothetical protein
MASKAERQPPSPATVDDNDDDDGGGGSGGGGSELEASKRCLFGLFVLSEAFGGRKKAEIGRDMIIAKMNK